MIKKIKIKLQAQHRCLADSLTNFIGRTTNRITPPQSGSIVLVVAAVSVAAEAAEGVAAVFVVEDVDFAVFGVDFEVGAGIGVEEEVVGTVAAGVAEEAAGAAEEAAGAAATRAAGALTPAGGTSRKINATRNPALRDPEGTLPIAEATAGRTEELVINHPTAEGTTNTVAGAATPTQIHTMGSMAAAVDTPITTMQTIGTDFSHSCSFFIQNVILGHSVISRHVMPCLL